MVGTIIASGVASATAIVLAFLGFRFYKRQVKFAWLHREQTKAIVQMYRHVKRTHIAFTILFTPGQADGSLEAEAKRRANAWKSLVRTYRFLEENDVFFGDELMEQFKRLPDEYRRQIIAATPEVPKGLRMKEAWDDLGELLPLIAELKEKIQKRLGVK